MKGRISANLEKILRSPQGSAQLRRVLTNQTDEPAVQVGEVKFIVRKVGQVASALPTTSKKT
jgi:hypothetical protein